MIALLVAVCVLFVQFHGAVAAVPESEISALFDLWSSTQGSEWAPALNKSSCIYNETDLCQQVTGGAPWVFASPLNETQPCLPGSARWRGLNCSATDHITGIILPFSGLNGTLPSGMCDLTALTVFSVTDNSLYGEIPSCISKLSDLILLDLKSNSLSGPVPDAMWELTQLRILALFHNHFTGSLAAGVGNLTNLIMLNLASNLFSDQLPSELGRLGRIVYLPIGENYFSGTIPSEMANMRRLFHLGLLGCALTGSIPSTLSSLMFLQSITLGDNQLTGSFPSFFSKISSLRNVQIYGNLLEGALPYIGDMRNVEVLQLQNNLFSGTLSRIFGGDFHTLNSSSLNTLDLSENRLTGTLPAEIFQLRTLFNLALSSNCFTGTLPSTICSARRIRSLSLDGLSSNNNCGDFRSPFLDLMLGKYVHGTIPSCVWNLPNLVSIHISGNRFSGIIGELLENSSLVNMSLSFNHFTGSLPLSVQRHSFDTLDVSFNTFTGEINEVSSVNVSLITELNRFSGRLPSSWSHLQATVIKVLRGNMFSCSNIPPSDEHSVSYTCGSRNLNNALYFSCGGIVLWVVVFLLVGLSTKRIYRGPLGNRLSNYFFCLDCIYTVNSESPNLFKFEMAMKQALYFMIAMSLATLVFLMPAYVMKIGYGYSSFEHSYSWVFSLAYSSGMWMGVVVMFAWTLLFLFGLWLLQYSAIDRGQTNFKPSVQQVTLSDRTNVNLWGISFDVKTIYFSSFVMTINAIVMLGANALYVYCIFLEMSNVSDIIIQISFAFFTLFWKFAVMSRLVSKSNETLARRVLLRVVMGVFSHVIAPSLVLFSTDPDCFRDIFIRPAEIESSYEYSQCMIFSVNGGCEAFIPVTITLEPFLPPFIYNNGCSSKLISAYVPVYLYLYTYLITVVPLSHFFFAACVEYTSLPHPLRPAVPGLLWPKYWSNNSTEITMNRISVNPLHHDERKLSTTIAPSSSSVQANPPLVDNFPHMFKPEAILSQIVNNFCIMFTFGLAYPPLLIAVLGTSIVTYTMWKLILGRFLYYRMRDIKSNYSESTAVSHENLAFLMNHDVFLQHIEKSLCGIESAFEMVKVPVIFCSSVVISFLLYDMVANDSSSPYGADTVLPMVTLSMPIMVKLVAQAFAAMKKNELNV